MKWIEDPYKLGRPYLWAATEAEADAFWLGLQLGRQGHRFKSTLPGVGPLGGVCIYTDPAPPKEP